MVLTALCVSNLKMILLPHLEVGKALEGLALTMAHGLETRTVLPGETYRAKSRTWCDPSGGAYSALWTGYLLDTTDSDKIRR